MSMTFFIVQIVIASLVTFMLGIILGVSAGRRQLFEEIQQQMVVQQQHLKLVKPEDKK